MDVEAFLAKLEKLRYFEGYSDAAIAKAIKAIRKHYVKGLASEDKGYFESFPGLALVVTDFDQEMMGQDDLKDVLPQLGRASLAEVDLTDADWRLKRGIVDVDSGSGRLRADNLSIAVWSSADLLNNNELV